MQHDATHLLTEIRNLWPELDNVPTGRRRDLPRALTAEQRERARERWEDEITDKLAGAVGRGASPAPCNLDQLQAKLDLTADLCDLADRVASRVGAHPSTPQWVHHVSLTRGIPSGPRLERLPTGPGRWDYTHSQGAAWTLRWLTAAVDAGVPPLVADDITATARHVLRQIQRALDGQREHFAGRCTNCGTPLAVTDWDEEIACPGCPNTYSHRGLLRLRMLGAA
ncbi:hypothetical protein ACU686_40415 [Yinghuangia aomiensis]